MLNLIVITTKNIELSLRFYQLFNLNFEKEQHEKGPVHYSSQENGLVIEIYPETEKFKADSNLRLGFEIRNFEEFKNRILDKNITFKESEDFLILEDPDGRKVFVSK